MDSIIPDQFLFVNKSATSSSLSHSTPDEGFFIYSHVHGKYHKQKKQTRQRSLLTNSPSSSGRTTSSITSKPLRMTDGLENSKSSTTTNLDSRKKKKNPKEVVPDLRKVLLGSYATQSLIDAVAIDPFYCTSAVLDARDQRLLFYPFTSFIETTFNAESLLWTTSSTLFRHREAIVERLRHCVVDELTMYSTLAYCASCMRWAVGKRARERPPEYYVLKAIAALKVRLERADIVDDWLILSIYALAVSEMWAQNCEAAASHLKMTRHLVIRNGGLTKLNPYLMESVLLCDKYVAIGRSEAPIFPLDWEPAPLPTQKMPNSLDAPLSELAQGFFELEEHLLGPKILQIIHDIRVCALVSQQLGTQAISDPADQHWLFLRHQAIFWRLLSMPTASSATQNCCHVALIIWLLKVTVYFGAQRWSKRLLPRLKAAILDVDNAAVEGCPPRLLFWITCLGAMTAEYTEEREWFLRRTAEVALLAGIERDKGAFRDVLGRFLFLECEDGLQFFRMVRAVEEV